MTQTLTSPNGTLASALAFGTMQFGASPDATASRAMFDACLDAGITHFAGLAYDMPADVYQTIAALSPKPPPATDRIEEQQ